MKYILDCDNGIGGGEYIVFNSLEDAQAYADRRASYCQRDINIYSMKHTYFRRWWGTCSGIEECKDPIQFGNFGFYGDWQEIDEDNSDLFRNALDAFYESL